MAAVTPAAKAGPATPVPPLLRQHLKTLFDRYLQRQEVVEVCVNRPGEVCIETPGGWEIKKDAALTLPALNDFLSTLATHRQQRFDDAVPFLATTIPGYEFRIQAVGGAVAAEGIAVAIRCGRARRYPIPGYFGAESFACETPADTVAEYLDNQGDADRLIEAVERGANVLIAGPTGSGKTTFLNSLLTHIPLHLRLGLVEDSRELVVDHVNHFRLLKSKTGTDIAKVTWEQIVDALMRLRPDGILFSEIDIRNTVPFLLLMNTGHKWCFATIHANEGAPQAIRRMVLNAQLGGLAGGAALVEQYALQELDAVVFVHKVGAQTWRATVEFLKKG
jgi:type IV secretion system protein VirB11